jgi:hypothetical protein
MGQSGRLGAEGSQERRNATEWPRARAVHPAATPRDRLRNHLGGGSLPFDAGRQYIEGGNGARAAGGAGQTLIPLHLRGSPSACAAHHLPEAVKKRKPPPGDTSGRLSPRSTCPLASGGPIPALAEVLGLVLASPSAAVSLLVSCLSFTSYFLASS